MADDTVPIAASEVIPSSAPVLLDTETEEAMAVLRGLSKGGTKPFRTFLRTLAGGFHFEQAMQMVRLRAKVQGAELLADDINMMLGRCAMATDENVIEQVVRVSKRRGVLSTITNAAVTELAATALSRHDCGMLPHIANEQFRRSKEAHVIATAAGNKRARTGTGGVAASAAKRGKVDGDGEAVDGSGSPATEATTSDEVVTGGGAGDGKAARVIAVDVDYPRVFTYLMTAHGSDVCKHAPDRLRRAQWLFDAMKAELGIEPNARTFVLMIKCALAAKDVAAAKSFLSQMFATGAATQETLYQFIQPAFMRELIGAGVLEGSETLFHAEEGSQKWCFLTAAAEAAQGDQMGSKHGSVFVKEGKFLNKGHNHRYMVAGNPHIRVMHAEVHAMVQTPTSDIFGSECYVVELDSFGVGYEEAVPCPMCQSGLCQHGVKTVHYSSHSGIVTVPNSHRPHLICQGYEYALKRLYPKGTNKPDSCPVGAPIPPEWLEADARVAAASGGAGVDSTATASAPPK